LGREKSNLRVEQPMKNRILPLIMLAVLLPVGVWACTSALVSIERGNDGRWLLWKHRDSGFADNYVMNFAATDSTLAYVALFNAPDTLAREAWIGYNSAGFAVMNTATYNLTAPAKDWQDREGLLMTEALHTCRTLADFYALLMRADGTARGEDGSACNTDGSAFSNSGKARGVEANFGAFDAEGNGAYFEVDNLQVTVFPMDSISAMALAEVVSEDEVVMPQDGSVSGLLTRTNYSLSGSECNRLGVSRHCSEQHLLDSIMQTDRPWAPAGKLAAEDLLETLSRSFYLPAEGIDLLDGTALRRRDTGDVISRRSSSASVVIEGPRPKLAAGLSGEKATANLSGSGAAGMQSTADDMRMWVAIGFPALSEVREARPDSVSPDLLPTAPSHHSPLCDRVNRLRSRAFLPAQPNGSATKASSSASKTKPAKTKPQYDFNLPYLREQIPQLRAASLRLYRR
jgi:hypothetical protein